MASAMFTQGPARARLYMVATLFDEGKIVKNFRRLTRLDSFSRHEAMWGGGGGACQ